LSFNQSGVIIKKPNRIRINQYIKAPRVRTIDSKGEQAGVLSTAEALKIASVA
jgi:translation initiation factor IF-3